MILLINLKTMSTDIDQNKLRVAIEWIGKLTDGVNPIDDSVLPDSDIVNNIQVSRCLFYVYNLLEDVAHRRMRRQSSKKQELEFHLTPEMASNVQIAEKTGIAMFVKEINRVIPENMKPLSAPKVTQWLMSVGYLEERERDNGHKYRAPTELGNSIGITSSWVYAPHGTYLAVSYDPNAQRFLLDNLFKFM